MAPDYWNALAAIPYAVVWMTPLLYLLLDWNNSTRCLVVRDLFWVKISKHCYSLENITMSLKWWDWMEKWPQHTIVWRKSACINILSMITATIYQHLPFKEVNLRLSWCFKTSKASTISFPWPKHHCLLIIMQQKGLSLLWPRKNGIVDSVQEFSNRPLSVRVFDIIEIVDISMLVEESWKTSSE